MLSSKKCSWWSGAIGTVWIGSFSIHILLVLIFLGLIGIGGLDANQIWEIVKGILQGYLPYIGVIVGAYIFMMTNKVTKKNLLNLGFPLTLLGASVLYNFGLIILLILLLLKRLNGYQEYLSLFRDISMTAAFLGGMLTYFFKSCGVKPVPVDKDD